MTKNIRIDHTILIKMGQKKKIEDFFTKNIGTEHTILIKIGQEKNCCFFDQNHTHGAHYFDQNGSKKKK